MQRHVREDVVGKKVKGEQKHNERREAAANT